MHTAVASCAMLPLESGSVDIAVSVFAPVKDLELKRILKPEGRVIMVLPGKDHLLQLKKAVYDTAYQNPDTLPALKGFTICNTQQICYDMQLSCSDDINNLFMMTPYYYKSSYSDQQKLKRLNSLNVTAQFKIVCLQHERNV